MLTGVGRVAPEITYIKTCMMQDRALTLWRAKFPSVDSVDNGRRLGLNADPRAVSKTCPYLKGEPLLYTKQVAKRCANGTSRREEVHVESVLRICSSALAQHLRQETDEPAWQEINASVEEAVEVDELKILDFVTAS
jgi:hypothetical protein